MAAMIDEILAHAALGAELARHDVDLTALLGTVTRDLAPAIGEAGAAVLAGALPTVHADANQLYVVLLNLVANALKFRRPDVRPKVLVEAEARPAAWRVLVSDNGRGVPAGRQDRLFDLFARGEVAGVPGHGIGLATVKAIVEAHGGNVGLRASALGGVTVWFELPRVSPGGRRATPGE
jgi:signal transduction histidine kinase